MPYSIALDAASVRDEVADAPIYTEAQRAYIADLGDEDLSDAIEGSVNDAFWHAYDALRSDAINELLARDGAPADEDDEEAHP